MRHLQIIKEHVDIIRLIAGVNIQISILICNQARLVQWRQNPAIFYLLRIAVVIHVAELFVKKNPVQVRLGLVPVKGSVIGRKKPGDLRRQQCLRQITHRHFEFPDSFISNRKNKNALG